MEHEPKEIHVILEREQEEEHRRAVISNVSTQSEPTENRIVLSTSKSSLVSFTSCSSWTHTHSNVSSVIKQRLQEDYMQQFDVL